MPDVETLAELVTSRHEEYVRRFDAIDAAQEAIAKDVKSLLESRAFVRGMMRMTAIVGTVLGALVGWFVAWWRR